MKERLFEYYVVFRFCCKLCVKTCCQGIMKEDGYLKIPESESCSVAVVKFDLAIV